MKTAYFVIAALAIATAGAAIGAEQSAATVTASAATTAAAATTTTARAGLTREEVRAQTIAARKNGRLAETEADSDIANIARAAQ
jgi:hypothetical protein